MIDFRMRKIIEANYEETLKRVILLEEALPPSHLARFVVDIIAQLDLRKFYKQYSQFRITCYRLEEKGVSWQTSFCEKGERHENPARIVPEKEDCI